MIKKSFHKQVKSILEAFIFYIFFLFFFILPYKVASWMGGKITRLVGPFLPVSQIARDNLRRVFPIITKKETAKILRDMWENLGRSAGEFPHMHKIIQDPKAIEIEGVENLLSFQNENVPGIFFSAHLANWELSSLVAAHHHIPICLIYRAANNPFINKRILRTRSQEQFLKYVPKGTQGAKEALRALSRGKKVGMLVDQKMNDGIYIPFFGIEASTAPALAQLARKFKTQIMPAVVIRVKGSRFKVVYEKPFQTEYTENEQEDIRKTMIQINQIVEQWILAHPAQWLWLHKRWRS